MKLYFLHIWIALNQFVTTLIGGWPDETLSSYAWRMDQKGTWWGKLWRPTIDWIFSWQKYPLGHCHAAMQEEIRCMQLPRELR